MGCFYSKVKHDPLPHSASRANSVRKHIENSARSSHKNSLHLVGSENESIKTLTFKHVMRDPLGREFFMKFLKLEHAEENLLFFEEVERIKAEGVAQLPLNAALLVDNYLTPGVETEVNISDNMKKTLTALAQGDLDQSHLDFFKALDRAENEVMMILAMGAFPRFLKSKFFSEYKAKSREMRDKDNEEASRSAEKVK